MDFKNFIELLKREYSRNGTSELFNQCIDKVCELPNSKFIFLTADQLSFLRNPDFATSISKLQSAIIKNNQPQWCTEFARFINGADIPALEKVVIESNSLKWNYLFAKHIKNADIHAHEAVFLNRDFSNSFCNSPYYYYFARDIQGANIQAFSQKVASLPHSTAQNSFCISPNAPEIFIPSIEGQIFAQINYLFAKNFKNINIKPHSYAVIKSGDAQFNYYFARDIPNSYITGHAFALLSLHKSPYLHFGASEFAPRFCLEMNNIWKIALKYDDYINNKTKFNKSTSETFNHFIEKTSQNQFTNTPNDTQNNLLDFVNKPQLSLNNIKNTEIDDSFIDFSM